MKKSVVILSIILACLALLTCEFVPVLDELPHDNPMDPASPDYVASAFTVTYFPGDASGGTAPADGSEYTPGSTVTVLGNTGSLIGPVIRDGIRQAFIQWNTKEDGSGTAYDGGDTFTITENATLYAMYTSDTDVLRKIGPAGGWVFYDQGSYSDGWRYLEAAPADQSTAHAWSNITDTLVPGTHAAVGYGAGNTINMVAQDSTGGYAGTICMAHSKEYGGTLYDDWFLPSKDELNLMYLNLHKGDGYAPVGGFTNTTYWSSSESTQFNAEGQNFSGGSQNNFGKEGLLYLRAARTFTSSTSYALRDRGPANGWIFSLEDNADGSWTYLEAEETDQSSSTAWSNVTDTPVLLGDNPDVGDGMHNSRYIIVQSGHLDSAAKICLDYTLNGYSDWFLPSKNELFWMYKNLHEGVSYTPVGDFGSVYYWSSSEYSQFHAWRQAFSDGSQNYSGKEFTTFGVRAVRAF